MRYGSLRDLSHVAIGRVGAMLGQAVILLVVSHALAPAAMSGFQLQVSLIGLAATLAQLGMAGAATGSIAAARRREGDDGMRRCAAGLLGATVWAAIVMAALYAGVGFWCGWAGEGWLPALVCALTVIPMAVGGVSAEIQRGFGDQRAASWNFAPLLNLLQAGCAVGILVWALHPGALHFLVALSVSAAIASVWAWRQLSNRGRITSGWWRPAGEVWRTIWATRWAFALSILVLVSTQADIWLANALFPADLAGLYVHGQRVAGLCTIPLILINQSSSPRIAAGLHAGRIDEVTANCRENARHAGVVSGIAVLILAVGGPGLYTAVGGPSWAGAWAPCLVLCLGQWVCALLGPVYLLVFVSGATARFVLPAAGLLLAGLLAAAWAGSRFGSLGLASAIAATAIAVKFASGVLVRRHVGVTTWAWRHPGRNT